MVWIRMKRKRLCCIFAIFCVLAYYLSSESFEEHNKITDRDVWLKVKTIHEKKVQYQVINEKIETLKRVKNSKMGKIAIFGATGNIGSHLTLYLTSVGFKVVAYDMDPQILQPISIKMHSNLVNHHELKEFSFVIFLGGCTGRRTCTELKSELSQKVNVDDVVSLARKMDSTQHLIVASTSAISEGRQNAKEADPIFVNKLDDYSYSMYKRELALKRLLTEERDLTPRISMLRFGTVIGVSPGQRTDLLVPRLYSSAYKTGVLNVEGFNIMRSFLWLDDLSRAIKRILTHTHWESIEKFNIWNLASFSATILKVATTVASITGASINNIEGIDGETLKKEREILEFKGFSLDCSHFTNTFKFTFEGNLQNVLKEFDQNVPESITAKGAHLNMGTSSTPDSIPCPVCGSTNQQFVMDLGDQPFANDFRTTESLSINQNRFPLKLVRCRVCNHLHLSHIASREELFVHYLYQSGTSNTLTAYFEWFANEVIKEHGNKNDGAVLDIACNDGSQLDAFSKRGWKTFGVDPAANLARIAQDKGHTIKIGFWGEDIQFADLPTGDDLTAIVAQNVFAHVPHPVAFLKACAAIMGASTRLYVQTSQCNMHQLGQFDTAYHEHVSFFTGHSFLKASELAGLHITSFKTTPIHGTSCLVTMQLPKQVVDEHIIDIISETMHNRIMKEVDDGITTDFFYEKYAARAQVTRDWIIDQIYEFKRKEYTVGAYGAAAKGMTLLHYILSDSKLRKTFPSGSQWIEFVLDDAPLKQNTFCPGTNIPVYSTDFLRYNSNRKLALIIFAWNFWEEIARNIKRQLIGFQSEVMILLPFPTPKLFRLYIMDGSIELLREAKYTPTNIPNFINDSKRKKVGLVSHFRNEEMLMPFFILHHAPMFDHAILIDFMSTDRTSEIIEKYAPPSWKVIESTTGKIFDAILTDAQVMHWEDQYPKDWAIALTTTEFLIYDNFRQNLFSIQPNDSYPYVHRFHYLPMIGNDTQPLIHFSSLLKQRHQFYIDPTIKDGYGRFLHLNSVGTLYGPGRHQYSLKENSTGTELNGFIVKWLWTPWPESLSRKLKVGETISKWDIKWGFGYKHTKRLERERTNKTETEMQMLKEKKVDIQNFPLQDLCDDPIHQNVAISVQLCRCQYCISDQQCFLSNETLNLLAIRKIFRSVAGTACGSF